MSFDSRTPVRREFKSQKQESPPGKDASVPKKRRSRRGNNSLKEERKEKEDHSSFLAMGKRKKACIPEGGVVNIVQAEGKKNTPLRQKEPSRLEEREKRTGSPPQKGKKGHRKEKEKETTPTCLPKKSAESPHQHLPRKEPPLADVREKKPSTTRMDGREKNHVYLPEKGKRKPPSPTEGS